MPDIHHGLALSCLKVALTAELWDEIDCEMLRRPCASYLTRLYGIWMEPRRAGHGNETKLVKSYNRPLKGSGHVNLEE